MDSIDVPFQVPFVHRLRSTRDVLGNDHKVLADLLESSDGGPARVQFWVDQRVADCRPDLKQRIRGLVFRHPERLTQVGSVQIVPGGEEIKNDIHILERILKVLHAANMDRRNYIVAIGGGAVLDAVGFAVAIAHRGLRLVRLPTTTLAQSDSGIGVKNAVNLFRKKNWIGTFAVPWAVINDARLLETLEDRDFKCGFVEAVKVALLKDPQFFDRICQNAHRIRRRDMKEALPVIRQSAQWHLQHITQGGDPFEMREARPLDFGHWSAHKLETLSDYTLRHGEAVAIGVAIDTVYSSLVHGLPEREVQRVFGCLNNLGFVLNHPVINDIPALLSGLEDFRQHLGGRLTLTLLRAVGDSIDVHDIDRAKMEEAIARVVEFAAV